MRLRVPSAVLGVVLLATAVRGADTGTPLESTTQELRKLDGGSKPGLGPSATEGLRPSMPAIQTPGQESQPSLPLMNSEKLEKKRQKEREERKNWLVNGVEELERKDKEKAAGAFIAEENKTDGDNPRSTDGNDPQFLLKLYDEQKKTEETRKLETKPVRSATADPLAPFLQAWLGNSPVRAQFFDEFVAKPKDTPIASGAPDPRTFGGGRDFGSGPVPQASPLGHEPTVKPNPYLAELNRPVQAEMSDSVLSMQHTLNQGAAQPSLAPTAIPAPEPPAEVRREQKKPLPAPLAEDRKYFPQQKKF